MINCWMEYGCSSGSRERSGDVKGYDAVVARRPRVDNGDVGQIYDARLHLPPPRRAIVSPCITRYRNVRMAIDMYSTKWRRE